METKQENDALQQQIRIEVQKADERARRAEERATRTEQELGCQSNSLKHN